MSDGKEKTTDPGKRGTLGATSENQNRRIEGLPPRESTVALCIKRVLVSASPVLIDFSEVCSRDGPPFNALDRTECVRPHISTLAISLLVDRVVVLLHQRSTAGAGSSQEG